MNSKKHLDRMYHDSLGDMAKMGLKLVFTPLRLLGQAGLSLIKFISRAVQAVEMLGGIVDITGFIRAREVITAGQAAVANAENAVRNLPEPPSKLQFALGLLKRVFVMALAEIAAKLADKGKNALSL